jgi:thiamine-monophosphate kinase
MKVREIGEFGLIERIAKIVEQADERIVLTIGDDAAVVRPSKSDLALLTTDLLVENVHFKLDSIGPSQLGYKALAVNISDIAAMGGLPDYAVISLALNPETDVKVVEEIYHGMVDVSRKYGVNIVGGDITKSDIMIINVAILGNVEETNLCRRSDAEINDIIMVTGKLGASAAGLRLALNPELAAKASNVQQLKNAHFKPKPRVREGRLLAELGIHAMLDISDGLASEIKHICAASDVGACLDLSKIPIADGVDTVAAQTGEKPVELALTGGEDYELVFTVSSESQQQIEKILAEIGTELYTVGTITDSSEGIKVIDWTGKKMDLSDAFQESGYVHF